uniref:Uncharacterized protein n=1 Tax=Candidatus Kentrum sp. FM TaxID=2126340 RepID=A0A450STY4_9GAMM|nr:MAG: hypothetical protein BECKFM1743A_GA0114220_101895 [Candidatus Kentron sp. FM]VFJ73201.1 MAG: hypothetical protein BECKFM1743C_GA0114222_107101 [Candidatus Kentron sp. FM]VFK20738.1 MAG: hypothetical protein BECKFM1743B_GA0114221_107221 [Candidatus Kentron sp. FM]
MLNPILKEVSENWPWLVPLLLYVFYLLRYHFKKKPLHVGDYDNLVSDLIDVLGRDKAIAWIKARTKSWGHIRYQELLDGLLGFFDRWFGEGWFNPQALHVCYLLAFIYPVVFVFVSWLFGKEGKIGKLEIFPHGIEMWDRLWQGGLLVGGIALSSYILMRVFNRKLGNWIEKRPKNYWKEAFVSLIAIIFADVVFFFVACTVSYASTGGVANVIGIINLVGPLGVVSAIAAAIFYDKIIAGSVSLAFLVAVVSAGILAFASSLSISAAFATGIIVIFFFSSFLKNARQKTREKIGIWLSGLYLFFVVLVSAYLFTHLGKRIELQAGIVTWTMIVLLPAINSLFDFISLQLSRWFLTQIKQHNRHLNILWGVADVLAAIVLLVGLYWAIFLSLAAVDRLLFPEVELFTVARWWELLWQERDWFNPEILWLTLMAFTTLIVTLIHLIFVFAHLLVPLWHRRDQERIAWLIREIEEKGAKPGAQKKVPEADCRALATAYYFPWEHGIVLGTLALWGLGYVLYTFVIRG